MSDFPNPAGEEWTDDRLLHEGVWLVEQQLEIDPTEVKAWAEFVRKVWTVRLQAAQAAQAAYAKYLLDGNAKIQTELARDIYWDMLGDPT